jgi:hypothetical protein
MGFVFKKISCWSIFSWDRIATPNPWLLEKGEYTIGVKFEHLINGKNVELTCEAKIEIK